MLDFIIVILLVFNAILQFYIFRLIKMTRNFSKNIDISQIMNNFDSDFWCDTDV